MKSFPAFPSRTLWGSLSEKTIQLRKEKLNAFFKAAVRSKDIPLGIVVDDDVVVFKAGKKATSLL